MREMDSFTFGEVKQMKVSHTRGPWAFNVGKNPPVKGLPCIRIYSDAADDMVLDFACSDGERSIANAKLITLAPELYDAVFRIACDLYITNREPQEQAAILNSIWQQCRKLVEKYEGEA